MAKDVIITPADGDVQFKNASSVEAGRIEQTGDDLAITNAVGDVLIGDGASDLYIGDGVNSVDIVFDVNGSVRGEAGVTLTLGASGSTTAIAGLSSSTETSAVMRNTTTGALTYRTLGSNAFNSTSYLTSESDPVFTASPASGITSGDISNWDTSYNNSLSGVSFNTGTGVLTVSAIGGAYTTDLDGRYLQLSGGTLSGDLNIGNGSANTRLIVDKADNNVSDHVIFEVGGTRVGEIGAHDTTWLRINQSTSKNIYTPRYIRADNGFFVDGTDKGINGSGNFIGGTITGASDANVSNWDNAYNNSLTGVTFSTANGILSVNAVGGAYTADLDGRYLQLSGGTLTGTLTSTATEGLLVDSSTFARINLDANNNWSYVRFSDNGSVSWDIASYNSGNLEWRPSGQETNKMTYDSSGNLTLGSSLRIVDSNTALTEGSGNAIRHQTNSGYIDVGPQNTTWAHIYTDRNNFYFNKNLYVLGDRVVKTSDNIDALNDYEEGTFTPAYGHTSGNPSTVTYDTGNTYGKYTKIGNVVHCSGRIRTDAITWASTTYNTVLKGFPFTCSSPLSTGTGCVAGVIGFAGGFASTKPVTFQMRDGQTEALLYGESIISSEVRGQPNIKSGDFTTGTNADKNFITFQITYHTS